MSRYYSGCETSEAVLAVGRLLHHPVDQSCSPRSIHPSHQTPPILQPLSPSCQLLQAPDGPNWKIISFLGMGGGGCSNPPLRWSARSQKILRLTSSHWSQQAPHQSAQNLWDRVSHSQAGKSHPLGNNSLHCGRGNILL